MSDILNFHVLQLDEEKLSTFTSTPTALLGVVQHQDDEVAEYDSGYESDKSESVVFDEGEDAMEGAELV